MLTDEEIKDIKEHVRKFSTLSGISILQVDATVIIGVLFFLTLSSYLGASTEEVARLWIAIYTSITIIPFVASAVLTLLSNDKAYLVKLASRLDKEERETREHKDYVRMDKFNRYASTATLIGFANLVLFLTAIAVFSYNASNMVSLIEDCGGNPELYGVNIWQCSMFSPGSLAEQCANDPSLYHMNQTSDCSRLIPPTNPAD